MAKKPQNTKKQHTVPQLYLRPFADEKAILWAYDKISGKKFQVGVRDAAQEHGFFSIQELDRDKGAGWFAETYFQMYENPAEIVIKGLLCGMKSGVICLISDDAREPLARFIAVQLQRTHAARARLVDFNHALNVLAEHVSGTPPDDLRPHPIPDGDLPLVHLKASLDPETVSLIARHLRHHVWALYINRSPATYYTSDHPVTLHSLDMQNSAVGINSYGAEISLPLSPNHLLVLVERRWAEKFIPQYAARDGCIWGAHAESDARFYRNMQVSSSHRFVYAGSSEDLDFAEEVCSAHPQLRDPNRAMVNIDWAGEHIYGPDSGGFDWSVLGRR